MPKKDKPRAYSASLYYMQPDGSYKRGGDGRSEGKTLAELKALGAKVQRGAKLVDASSIGGE